MSTTLNGHQAQTVDICIVILRNVLGTMIYMNDVSYTDPGHCGSLIIIIIPIIHTQNTHPQPTSEIT